MSDSFLCQLCRSFSSIMSQQFKIKFHSSFPNFVPTTIPYNEKVEQGSYRFFKSFNAVFVLGINLQQYVGMCPAGRRWTSKLTSCSVLFDFWEKLRAAFILFGSFVDVQKCVCRRFKSLKCKKTNILIQDDSWCSDEFQNWTSVGSCWMFCRSGLEILLMQRCLFVISKLTLRGKSRR